jgi:hypothetical protein
MLVLGDDRCGWGSANGECTKGDAKDALGEVIKMLDSPYWPATVSRAQAACKDLVTIANRFKKIVGNSIAISKALATNTPIHDDGCPVPGHLGADGEKHYSAADIEAACGHYAYQDADGGRVFTKEGAAAYVAELSEGKIDFDLLGVNHCAVLGYGAENEICLFREREVWNAMRTRFPDILTDGIVNASRSRGTITGWEA